MIRKSTDEKDERFLYFPLEKLSRNESVFRDADQGEFTDKFKLILKPILGKQLAVNTYYKNDLIAAANTPISIDLLRIFDELKINFKVNRDEITDEERDQAFYGAMAQIMKGKREFLSSVINQDKAVIQSSVKAFIANTLATNQVKHFHSQYQEMKGCLELACSIITSQERHTLTVAALKQIIENEHRVFDLGKDESGETITHIVKTAWISLLLARELDDFDEKDCEMLSLICMGHDGGLSLICMGHDGGKALIPEEILYKDGRLTKLENDIIKSHVLLSYLLSSNDQQDLNFESFAMALHHVKENKKLPQSYGIFPDTHTSFFEYLTPEAQIRLNTIYHSTKRYYRVIGIADTFEAISAPRVYKKASSIGVTLEIMLSSNKKDGMFYEPYLEAFVNCMILESLPKNLKFPISDELFNDYCRTDYLTDKERKCFKQRHMGVIIEPCSSLDKTVDCVIFDVETKKVKLKLQIPPLLFLKEMYFD